ncbi:Fc.00g084040.m01.CDS01 [Cosmosporella sp. VM-42]
MARLSASLVLLGILSFGLVTAEYDQEKQNKDADCDNGCFFGSFPGNSCANDVACMCTLQKYRERYFCCMAEKCGPDVLPDSIQRQTLECEARGMEFTFDVEAVCGITLTTSSNSLPSATSTATSDSSSTVSASASAAEVSTTGASDSTATGSHTNFVAAVSSTGTSDASSTTSQTTSGGVATPTDNSAPVERVMLNTFAFIVATSVMILW